MKEHEGKGAKEEEGAQGVAAVMVVVVGPAIASCWSGSTEGSRQGAYLVLSFLRVETAASIFSANKDRQRYICAENCVIF